MARHKPAAEGGYQRGEETRARIVEAAVVVFGERGYDGASTRDIATAAGVNAPAIQYYFDGKEGVYLECVEHLITLLWRKMAPSVEAAESALADAQAGDATLIEVSLGILGTVVSTIQDSPQTTDGAVYPGLGVQGAKAQIARSAEVGRGQSEGNGNGARCCADAGTIYAGRACAAAWRWPINGGQVP